MLIQRLVTITVVIRIPTHILRVFFPTVLIQSISSCFFSVYLNLTSTVFIGFINRVVIRFNLGKYNRYSLIFGKVSYYLEKFMLTLSLLFYEFHLIFFVDPGSTDDHFLQ